MWTSKNLRSVFLIMQEQILSTRTEVSNTNPPKGSLKPMYDTCCRYAIGFSFYFIILLFQRQYYSIYFRKTIHFQEI